MTKLPLRFMPVWIRPDDYGSPFNAVAKDTMYPHVPETEPSCFFFGCSSVNMSPPETTLALICKKKTL